MVQVDIIRKGNIKKKDTHKIKTNPKYWCTDDNAVDEEENQKNED